MARPVKITNIGTHQHAAKLVKALKKDYPGWSVAITEQSDNKYAVSASPPVRRPAGNDEENRSACSMPLPHWIDREPVSKRKRIRQEPASPVWNCHATRGATPDGFQFRT